MNVPRLEIYLNDESKLCIAKVERADEGSLLMVDIELDEIKSYGPDGAASRLGSVLINILKLWHKREFAEWGDLPVPHEEGFDDYDVAHRLIEKSVSNQTAIYVQSIDALLLQESGEREDVKRFFEESWPIIRKRLQSFGTGP